MTLAEKHPRILSGMYSAISHSNYLPALSENVSMNLTQTVWLQKMECSQTLTLFLQCCPKFTNWTKFADIEKIFDDTRDSDNGSAQKSEGPLCSHTICHFTF